MPEQLFRPNSTDIRHTTITTPETRVTEVFNVREFVTELDWGAFAERLKNEGDVRCQEALIYAMKILRPTAFAAVEYNRDFLLQVAEYAIDESWEQYGGLRLGRMRESIREIQHHLNQWKGIAYMFPDLIPNRPEIVNRLHDDYRIVCNAAINRTNSVFEMNEIIEAASAIKQILGEQLEGVNAAYEETVRCVEIERRKKMRRSIFGHYGEDLRTSHALYIADEYTQFRQAFPKYLVQVRVCLGEDYNPGIVTASDWQTMKAELVAIKQQADKHETEDYSLAYFAVMAANMHVLAAKSIDVSPGKITTHFPDSNSDASANELPTQRRY